MKLLLPYDRKQIPIEIDDRNFAGLLESKVESYRRRSRRQSWSKTRWIILLDHPHLRGWRKERRIL